jgi:hypothetical protein
MQHVLAASIGRLHALAAFIVMLNALLSRTTFPTLERWFVTGRRNIITTRAATALRAMLPCCSEHMLHTQIISFFPPDVCGVLLQVPPLCGVPAHH